MAWLLAALSASVVCAAPSPQTGSGGDAALGPARREFEAGRYAQAAALLSEASRRAGADAAVHYWWARSEYEQGRYDRAAESAQRAAALEPGRSEYHRWLGRALGGRAEHAGWLRGFGLARRVRAEFEAAVRLGPCDVAAQRDLIEFYRQAPGIVGGGVDKARRQIDALAAVDPVEARLARARLLAGRGDLEAAAAEYRAVTSARPQRAGPYLEAADFYEQRQDAPHLAEAVEAAAAVEPSDPQLAYYRGVAALLATGREGEAESWLRLYVDTVPPRSDRPSPAAAREWLGRLYERLGRPEAAAAEYRAALRLEPDRKGARDALRRRPR